MWLAWHTYILINQLQTSLLTIHQEININTDPILTPLTGTNGSSYTVDNDSWSAPIQSKIIFQTHAVTEECVSSINTLLCSTSIWWLVYLMQNKHNMYTQLMLILKYTPAQNPPVDIPHKPYISLVRIA